MKKTILSILTVSIFGSKTFSQAPPPSVCPGKFQWAKQIASIYHDLVNAVVLNNNVVYSTGSYIGTTSFGNGISLTSTGGSMDMFIAAHDINGNCLWAKSIGTANAMEEGYGICKTNNNYLYVTGAVNPGTSSGKLYRVDLGTNVTVTEIATMGNNMTCVTSEGSNAYVGGVFGNDVFVAKYNSTGTLMASNVSNNVGNTGATANLNAITYASGYVYVTGSYKTALGFNANTINTPTTVDNGADVFVARFNYTNLTNSWMRSAGGSGYGGLKGNKDDVGYGITISNGDVYVTGSFRNSADFSGQIIYGDISAGSDNNAFLAKYNILGSLNWVTTITSPNAVTGYSVSGTLYGIYVGLSGYSNITANNVSGAPKNLTNPGFYSDYLIKYNSAGQPQWISTGYNKGFVSKKVSVSAVALSSTCTDLAVGGSFGDANKVYPAISFSPTQAGTVITLPGSGSLDGSEDGYVSFVKECCAVTIQQYDNYTAIARIGQEDQTQIEAKEFAITVYPNPSSGIFTISATGLVEGNVKLTVTDILGSVVYSNLTQGDQVNNSTIDLGHLSNGTYILQLENEGQVKMIKLMKQ